MSAAAAQRANVFQRRQDDDDTGRRPSLGGTGPTPLNRPVARSAHGAYTPPGEADPQPKDPFTGRPLTHCAGSPVKDSDLPRIHADPCLQPLAQPPPAGANILSFMSSASSSQDLMQEAKMNAKLVNETRQQYENLINEQRRKSSMAALRVSTDSIERIDLVRPGQSNFGQHSPVPSPRASGMRSLLALQDDVQEELQLLKRAQPPGHRRRISGDIQGNGRVVAGSPSRVLRVLPPNPPSRPSSSERGSESESESYAVKPNAKKKKGNKRHLKGQGRIRVVVRKRPLNAAGNEGGEDVVDTIGKAVIVQEHKERIDLSKYTERQTFHFDEVLMEDDTNHDVYNRTALPLVDTFFEGGRASCFAYGQTGSGKTHTMLGHRGEEGLYLLVAKELFRRLSPTQRLRASFYEIYCNTLYDLLGGRKVLQPREDAHKKVNIVGLSEHEIYSVDDLLRLMAIAEKHRSSGATAANEVSSRSHAILSLSCSDDTDEFFQSVFKVIDLAGSERGADTAERGRKTQQEGAEINKSLLALKECIRGLDLGHKHIKFRGSKLTEVLRDSFTGNCRTVMIATLSPSSHNVEHSLNTLRYANRVKGLPAKQIDLEGRKPKKRSHSAGERQPQAVPPPHPGNSDGMVNNGRGRNPRAGRRNQGERLPRAKSMPIQPPRHANAVAATPRDDPESSDDLMEAFQGLNLPAPSVRAIKKVLQVERANQMALAEEVAALKKQLREQELLHKNELAMCRMVKKMDDQRIDILNDHNNTLQKKIQEGQVR